MSTLPKLCQLTVSAIALSLLPVTHTPDATARELSHGAPVRIAAAAHQATFHISSVARSPYRGAALARGGPWHPWYDYSGEFTPAWTPAPDTAEFWSYWPLPGEPRSPMAVAAPVAAPAPQGRVVLFPVTIFNEYHPHWVVGGER